MIYKSLPYVFEDRSGNFTSSDFDDIYDRMFFRVAPAPPQSRQCGDSTLMVYNTGRRSSSHQNYRPPVREPSVVLAFGPRGALGTIAFAGSPTPVSMHQYLKKTSLFSGSLYRKFTGSDGQEYRWSHKSEGQEWLCVDSDDVVVAHYNFKPPNKPAYTTSGNTLTIYEAFRHLSVEILASLTIMRHIAAHNL